MPAKTKRRLRKIPICEKCGLPKELCICETIAKEEKKIEVYIDRRKFGKEVTIIDNLSEDMNPQMLTKRLKQKLACGGTYKNKRIELQGNHLRKVPAILIKEGFPEDKIVVR